MNQEENLNPSSEDLRSQYGPYDPKLDLSEYKYPPADLLPEVLRPLFTKVQEDYPQYKMPLFLSGTESPKVRDLYDHPNVLLAGTIASGKTQFIYNQIIGWLYNFHPSELKLAICRSKPVDYNSIIKTERHFLAKLQAEQTPIAEDRQVQQTINGLLIECQQRLDLFQDAGVKTIVDYNSLFVRRELNPEQGHRYLPNVVLIMDDMQTFLDEETTKSLIALTRQNLYTGIYFIAATSQIMSRNITPQLRANFSIRLAMKLMSQNESRKILDRVGAEKLSPPGELIYEQGERLVKGFQPFLDYNTIQSICDFIGLQRGYPSAYLLPTYVDALEPIEFDLRDRDPLFEEAARLIVMHQQGSTSLIQRKLKLGYNQAGRIVDQLEAAGIVGPFEGSKAREVLYPDEYSLEQYLETLRNTDVPAIPCVSKPPEFDFEISKAQDKATDSPQKKISTKRSTLKNSTHSATLKSMPPDDSVSKAQTNLVMWVFIAIVALIIYLISGWERLVKWFS